MRDSSTSAPHHHSWERKNAPSNWKQIWAAVAVDWPVLYIYMQQKKPRIPIPDSCRSPQYGHCSYVCPWLAVVPIAGVYHGIYVQHIQPAGRSGSKNQGPGVGVHPAS